jgi:2-methylcitrate dehydratase PrpD
MAERTRSGGVALLRAIVAGYDVCARLSQALGIEKFRAYGHSSHSFGGILGSGVAAGALAGLDAAGVRNVLSYTAQQLGGLSCWARDVEHVQKAFHFGGMPARAGVTAAIMAQMGFTGVDDTWEGERGLFQAFRDFIEPAKLVANLGKVYEIENTSIKRWAVGYPIQAPMDAVSNLIARGVKGDDVERVTITIDDQGARTVNQRKMASINIQQLVAVMLLDGDVTFVSAHDEKRVSDPAVLKMKKRIELKGSEALGRTRTTQAIVEIVTRDGRRLKHHTKAVLGTAANPMSREQVADKSRDLLVPIMGARRTESLIESVWDIERIGDMRKLRRLLMV